MGWRKLIFFAIALGPSAAFAACSSDQGPLGNAPPRVLNPIPPDANDEDAVASPDAPSDAADAASDVDSGVPSGVLAIATGAGPHPDPTIGWGDHSCVIVGPDKSVYCWGANDRGQLGVGGALDGGLDDGGLDDGGVANDAKQAQRIALDEQGLPFGGADALALAAWHSCARKGNDLWCWGQRFSGAQAEPPFASNPDRIRPRLVGAFPIASVAAGGAHTCVVRATGHVACFGHSYFGELGRTPVADPTCSAPIFYDYPGMLGAPHTCAGDIADLTTVTSGVQALALGELHSCVMIASKIKCWGTNVAGELGNPIASTVEINPQDVLADPDAGTALDMASQLAAGGGKHTCALVSGKVWCWGSNASGELGVDPLALPSRASAAVVAGIDNVASIGVGDGVSCAVKADGTVWCWGADDVGQLGDGVPKASSAAPVQVKGPGNVGFLTSAKEVAPGRRHVCARLVDATAWCWGKNDRGQLGDGSGVDSLYPVKVKGLP